MDAAVLGPWLRGEMGPYIGDRGPHRRLGGPQRAGPAGFWGV